MDSSSRSTGGHHPHPGLLLPHHLFTPPVPDLQRGHSTSPSSSPSNGSGWRTGHPPKWKSHSFRRERPSSSTFASGYRGNPYDLLHTPSPAALGLSPDTMATVAGNGHSRISRRCSDPATSVIAAVMASRGVVPPHLPSMLPPHHLLTSPLAIHSTTSAHPVDISDDDQPLDMSTKKKKDLDETLDLSMRSSSPANNRMCRSVHGNDQNAIPRPSVITCAPSFKKGKLQQTLGRLEVSAKTYGLNGYRPMSHTLSGRSCHSTFATSTSPSISSMSSSSSHSESDAISDRASKLQILSSQGSSSDDESLDPVMEHFKRSLGGRYNELIRSKSSPISSSSSKSPPQKSRPFSNGIVLGNASQISNTVVTQVIQDVDDHFAKALGEQWLKLKSSSQSKSSDDKSPSPASTKLDETENVKEKEVLPNDSQTEETETSERIDEDMQQETEEKEVMDHQEQSPSSSPPRLVVEEREETPASLQ